MAEIPLSNGGVALVDDEDVERLSAYRWHCGHRGYAMHAYWKGKRTHMLLMHREVLRAEPGQQVDHINGNKLDNRRANLRFCTTQENARNRGSHRGTSSRFKGVSWITRDGKWLVSIKGEGKRRFLGYARTEEEGARLYDAAARKEHGEFARLNFPDVLENRPDYL